MHCPALGSSRCCFPWPLSRGLPHERSSTTGCTPHPGPAPHPLRRATHPPPSLQQGLHPPPYQGTPRSQPSAPAHCLRPAASPGCDEPHHTQRCTLPSRCPQHCLRPVASPGCDEPHHAQRCPLPSHCPRRTPCALPPHQGVMSPTTPSGSLFSTHRNSSIGSATGSSCTQVTHPAQTPSSDSQPSTQRRQREHTGRPPAARGGCC